jgi:hypothetical protein
MDDRTGLDIGHAQLRSAEIQFFARHEDGYAAWSDRAVQTVTIQAQGFRAASVDVAFDATADVRKAVRLQRVDASQVLLAGTVTAGDGTPLPEAFLLLWKDVGTTALPSRFAVAKRVDREGRFLIGPIAAGTYRLRISASGHVAQRHDVSLHADRVRERFRLAARAGVAPAAPGAGRGWDRPNLRVTIAVNNVPMDVLLDLLAETLDVPVAWPAPDSKFAKKLKSVSVSPSFNDTPAKAVLGFFSDITGFKFVARDGLLHIEEQTEDD